VYCADGPLLSGALAGADPATDPGIAGWLLAQGWHLEPVMSCPRCVRAVGAVVTQNERAVRTLVLTAAGHQSGRDQRHTARTLA